MQKIGLNPGPTYRKFAQWILTDALEGKRKTTSRQLGNLF
jgi:hypothetical protein